MTRDSDFIGLLQEYLDDFEGPASMPDELRNAIRAELPSIQQRPAWWPVRRTPTMTTPIRIALAAAAIVVAAAVGINLLRPNVGGPTPTPDSTPLAIELPAIATNLTAGTYRLSNPVWTPRSFTVAVPAGWRTEEGFVTKDGSGPAGDLYVVAWPITHVFADTCERPASEVEGLVEAGTAQQAVDALASQRGHVTTGPSAATVGGQPAQRLTFEVAADFQTSTCRGGVMRLWPDPGPDLNGGLMMLAGQTVTVHVIDLDGDVLVLAAGAVDGSSRAELDQLDQIVSSIRFASDGESVARHWVAAVNDGDAALMSSLMAAQVTTSDGTAVRADVISSILDTWCPMTIDSVEPSGGGYLMGVTYRDNPGSTCTAGAPGTTGTFVLEAANGKVTRVP